MFLLAAVALVAAMHGVLSIPSGYILHVEHTCSESVGGVSQVDITTDLSVVVKVGCQGRTVVVPSEDRVSYSFTASYQGDPALECVFNRRSNSGIYVLLVTVGWSEPSAILKVKEEKYLVTCVLDPHALNQTQEHDTQSGLLGAMELQGRMGADSLSFYTLEVTDIAGNPLLTHIDIGRKIQLRATMTPVEEELGFRAVSCNAVAGEYSYAVLRGGCGDGIIFPRDIGFTTDSYSIKSPFFTAFKLREAENILFNCNFTACMDNCDGDSCVHESRRRKRDVATPGLSNLVSLSSPELKTGQAEHTEGDLDPLKVEELGNLGIEVVPGSCRMTKRGLECRANHGVLDTSQHDDYYSLLAVSLLLVQAAICVGMIVAMILVSRRGHVSGKMLTADTPAT